MLMEHKEVKTLCRKCSNNFKKIGRVLNQLNVDWTITGMDSVRGNF